MNKIIAPLLAGIFFASCSGNSNRPAVQKNLQRDSSFVALDNDSTAGVVTDTGISNGIRVVGNGLKVEEAHLVTGEGRRLPEGNLFAVAQKVYCQLKLSGYREIDGRVKIGASEEILGDGEEVLVQHKDLFETLEDAKAEDARYVRLMAVITELQKPYRFFVVNFRVWDKNSKADLKGTYRFRIQ